MGPGYDLERLFISIVTDCKPSLFVRLSAGPGYVLEHKHLNWLHWSLAISWASCPLHTALRNAWDRSIAWTGLSAARHGLHRQVAMETVWFLWLNRFHPSKDHEMWLKALDCDVIIDYSLNRSIDHLVNNSWCSGCNGVFTDKSEVLINTDIDYGSVLIVVTLNKQLTSQNWNDRRSIGKCSAVPGISPIPRVSSHRLIDYWENGCRSIDDDRLNVSKRTTFTDLSE